MNKIVKKGCLAANKVNEHMCAHACVYVHACACSVCTCVRVYVSLCMQKNILKIFTSSIVKYKGLKHFVLYPFSSLISKLLSEINFMMYSFFNNLIYFTLIVGNLAVSSKIQHYLRIVIFASFNLLLNVIILK